MTTVLQALNDALHAAFAADERVYLLGEDVLDPYGGAFKVTRGLASSYPGRVLTTPVSEAGITGVAGGMALRGLRPVVEIMFGDFTTLIADQLINHLAKFRGMYNEQVRVPVVIRTPMGGRRGYGPTHSQSLEKHFLGVPGLQALAPCELGEPGELLRRAILYTEDPLLFIENKLLYLQTVLGPAELADFEVLPWPEPDPLAQPPGYLLRVAGAPPAQLTLTAYGYMAGLARRAVLELGYEHEIFVELAIPQRLAPFQLNQLIASAGRSGRLLTVEEGGLSLGWGAEVLAQAAAALGGSLRAAGRLAAPDRPIPAAGPLEEAFFPGVADIVSRAREMIKR